MPEAVDEGSHQLCLAWDFHYLIHDVKYVLRDDKYILLPSVGIISKVVSGLVERLGHEPDLVAGSSARYSPGANIGPT